MRHRPIASFQFHSRVNPGALKNCWVVMFREASGELRLKRLGEKADSMVNYLHAIGKFTVDAGVIRWVNQTTTATVRQGERHVGHDELVRLCGEADAARRRNERDTKARLKRLDEDLASLAKKKGTP